MIFRGRARGCYLGVHCFPLGHGPSGGERWKGSGVCRLPYSATHSWPHSTPSRALVPEGQAGAAAQMAGAQVAGPPPKSPPTQSSTLLHTPQAKLEQKLRWQALRDPPPNESPGAHNAVRRGERRGGGRSGCEGGGRHTPPYPSAITHACIPVPAARPSKYLTL